MLRHVDDSSATVWVETDGPATVDVLGHAEPTFQVGGHHYALVTLRGLSPDTEHEYQVRLDDELVWPPPDTSFPASVIRTLPRHTEHPVRIAFGSCRFAEPDDEEHRAKIGACALTALARRLATQRVRSVVSSA